MILITWTQCFTICWFIIDEDNYNLGVGILSTNNNYNNILLWANIPEPIPIQPIQQPALQPVLVPPISSPVQLPTIPIPISTPQVQQPIILSPTITVPTIIKNPIQSPITASLPVPIINLTQKPIFYDNNEKCLCSYETYPILCRFLCSLYLILANK